VNRLSSPNCCRGARAHGTAGGVVFARLLIGDDLVMSLRDAPQAAERQRKGEFSHTRPHVMPQRHLQEHYVLHAYPVSLRADE
jgi:hypothetical protein